jgi:hypothetical protein
MSKQPLIINNPQVVIEKRPGPNYIKTPLSDYKDWPLADGRKVNYGGTWYKTNDKAIASEITENIFNSRLVNKMLETIGSCIEKKEEYTKNEITDIIAQIFNSTDKDSSYYDSTQHIDKIDINSLFGAMGKEFFHLYKLDNAINITLSGQHLIKYLAEFFNNYFRNEFWKNKKYFDTIDPLNAVMQPVVKIIETDSVASGSIINISGTDMVIDDLFKISTDQYSIGDTYYGTFKDFKETPLTPTLNIDTKEIELQEVTYVMKHEVEKEMFEIEYDGGSLIITDDHSLIIERDNIIIEATVKELIDGDEIILIN